MNAPHFDVNNLPLTADSDGYIKAVLTEEHRVCDKIDARILEVENAYLVLGNELKSLSQSIEGLGMFDRWKIRSWMKIIAYRMSCHRAVLADLYDARWRRTYA